MRTVTVIVLDRKSWPYETHLVESRTFRREVVIAREMEDDNEAFERIVDRTMREVRSLIKEDVPFQRVVQAP